MVTYQTGYLTFSKISENHGYISNWIFDWFEEYNYEPEEPAYIWWDFCAFFNTHQTLIPTQPDSPSCLGRTRGEITGNKQARRKESYEPSRLHQQKGAPYKIFYFLFTPSRLHIIYC
jgi:hypothetical protein